MKRLSPKWINRLIVGLLLLGPLLVFVVGMFCALAGTHGSFDVLSDSSFYLGEGAGSWLASNWLTDLGYVIATDAEHAMGFQPVATFVEYIDGNMLHLATSNAYWGLFIYGYVYWCFHVILIDLAVYAIMFVPRLIFRVLSKLEGEY